MRDMKFFVGEYYHLYNRGVDKRTVFEDENDYIRFCQLLYLCNDVNQLSSRRNNISSETLADLMCEEIEDKIISIGAYCLMPNHFHILVKENTENGISKFMHKLSTAYTMYFNEKNDRDGSLFQGRYRARHLDSDEYLKYVFSYIHLNPVKLIDPTWKENGLKNKDKTRKYLNNYRHSSYLDFLEIPRLNSKILSCENFPNYFPDKKNFQKCIEDWLLFKEFYEG